MKQQTRKYLFGTIAILLFSFGFGTETHPYDYIACFLGGVSIGLI